MVIFYALEACGKSVGSRAIQPLSEAIADRQPRVGLPKIVLGERLARARNFWANDAFWVKGSRPPRSANGTQASAWRGNRSNARSTALKRPYWA